MNACSHLRHTPIEWTLSLAQTVLPEIRLRSFRDGSRSIGFVNPCEARGSKGARRARGGAESGERCGLARTGSHSRCRVADNQRAMYRHHLEKLTRTGLDDLLVDEGVIERAQLEVVQSEQDRVGGLLSDILITARGFDELELATLQSNRYGLPYVDVRLYAVRREAAELLPDEFCRRNGFVVLDQFGPTIAVAAWEVPSPQLVAEILAKVGVSTVFLYIGTRTAITQVLDAQVKQAAGRGAAHPSAGASTAKPGSTPPASSQSETSEVGLAPLDLPFVSMGLFPVALAAIAAKTAAAQPAADTGSATPAHKSALETLIEAPAPDAAPAVLSPAVEVARPRSGRSAPVLPAVPTTARPGGWSSIFDSGDANLRTSQLGGAAPEKRPAPTPATPRVPRG